VATQRDYYAILQVSRNASPGEIERAYMRLSEMYNPETSKKAKAEQRFAEIEEAYSVLSDRDKRRQYDREISSRSRIAGSLAPAEVLSNRIVWVGAATVIVSIVAIIALIIVFGGGDDGDDLVAATGTPTPVPTPTATLPAQEPTTAPDSPPAVSGEEITTPSGLRYIDLVPGSTEEVAQTGDTVVVNYTGWLDPSGPKFDSSLERPEPFKFTIGAGQVIKGWDEGVAGMGVGGQRRLLIPADLAYGEQGRPPTIPGNAPLIFDVVLVDVLVTAAPAPTAPPTDPAAGTPTAAPAQ
jgi:peptidylprolyl isomerase